MVVVNPEDAKSKFEEHLKNIEKIKQNIPQQKDLISSLSQKIISLIKLSFDDYEEKISEFKILPGYMISTGMSEHEIQENSKQYDLERLDMMKSLIVGYVEELKLLIDVNKKNIMHDYKNDDEFIPNTAFVIMALGKGDSDYIYDIIEKECKKLNIKSTRVDKMFGSGNINDEIIDSIEESEFIIVDLTHERPNVYYELGYAHGVGNDGHDILLVAKNGTKIHFDISVLRVKFYNEPKDLHDIVYSNLEKMIQKTRHNN